MKEIRRQNLRRVIAPDQDPAVPLPRGSVAKFAKDHGQDVSTLYQVLNGHRQVGDELARSLENAMSKPRGWMDKQQLNLTPERMLAAEEAIQFVASLTDDDLESWMKHGRLLGKNGPKGANNPFGGAKPRSSSDESGTQ